MPAAEQALSPLWTAAPALSPLERYRRERQQSREQLIAALTALQQQEEMEMPLRQAAAEQLLSLSGKWEREGMLEGVLAARGYEGIAVMEKAGLTLFVAAILTPEEAALLYQLIWESTGLPRENIRIVPC